MTKIQDFIYSIQQILYEIVYARDITKQFTYMNGRPYLDGFKAGHDAAIRGNKAVLLMQVDSMKEWKNISCEDKLDILIHMINLMQ